MDSAVPSSERSAPVAADPSTPRGLQIAVVGAGPVGLSLALLAVQRLPQATICVYDSLPAEHDISRDARTLALSLGSVQLLQQLGVWAAVAAQAAPIRAVVVSQQQPALLGLLDPRAGRRRSPVAEPQVCIRAEEEGVEQLGAVAPYGAIVAPLRAAWRAACEADPQRCQARYGTPVSGLSGRPGGVEVDAQVTERHDLAVIAEGGVFADQARKAVHRDYRQRAWVGTVTLADTPAGTAWERFTPQGPVALLPLPDAPGQAAGTRRASLVWCVPSDDDPVEALDDVQRRAVLAHIFPPEVGRFVGIGPLKVFPLGLNAERSLVAGRTVRIGNAAQTLHPVAGQGLNLGLRDAHALLQALRRTPDVDAALAQVAWQRAPDRWALIATTDFLARSFTWDLPGLSTLRGAALATLQQVPPLKSWLARRMMFGHR
ncbi:MAG: FAD-dependent monooxygenase [Burkholderiaceae bacterium]|nr:FAD-dependent monooxygenase [Burkholderiaceae bacterium]